MTGCKTIRDVQVVRIVDVKVEEVNPHKIELNVGIELHNARSFAGRVHDLACQVSLTDHFLAAGHLVDSVDLPAKSNTVVHVPFSVDSDQVTPQDFLSIFEPDIAYTMKGTAVAEKPFHLGQVKLDVKSTFPAPESMPVALSPESAIEMIRLRGVRIKEMGLLETTGTLQLTLRNPLRFPITLRGLEFEAVAGETTAADGGLNDEIQMQPGLNLVDMPVRLHLAGIAGGLMSGSNLSHLNLSGTATLREKGRTLKIQFTAAGQ